MELRLKRERPSVGEGVSLPSDGRRSLPTSAEVSRARRARRRAAPTPVLIRCGTSDAI